jgi:hypothetical protein
MRRDSKSVTHVTWRLGSRPPRWRRGQRLLLPPSGLEALEFLERSRDIAAEPVTAAPLHLYPDP